MKKLQISWVITLLCIAFTSCASKKWTNVTGNVNLEELMHKEFVHLYDDYKAGKIKISKIEQGEKEGKTIHRITYKSVYDDDDMDALLWQTVFMPMLLDD